MMQFVIIIFLMSIVSTYGTGSSQLDTKLTGETGDFGTSMSQIGNVLLIGDPDYNSGAGRVTFFTRTDPSAYWQFSSSLTTIEAVDRKFGNSVFCISEVLCYVGHPEAEENNANGVYQGTIHKMVWGGSSWSFDGSDPIIRPESEPSRVFNVRWGNGQIHSDGVSLITGTKNTMGKVWVVPLATHATYSSHQLVDTKASVEFGTGDMWIDGNRVMVAAKSATEGGVTGCGAVYYYEYESSAWVLKQTLTSPSNKETGALFGNSFSVDGATVVIGAPEEASGGQTRAGAVYTFTFAAGTWTFQYRMARDETEQQLGYAVDLDIATGRYITTTLTTTGVYSYKLSGSSWVFDYHTSPNTGTMYGGNMLIDDGNLDIIVSQAPYTSQTTTYSLHYAGSGGDPPPTPAPTDAPTVPPTTAAPTVPTPAPTSVPTVACPSMGLTSSHTCVVKRDNTLWCWGQNNLGQINGVGGSGIDYYEEAPIQVTSLGTNVAQVCGGDAHTCVRMLDGTAKCWGSDSLSQLGVSTTDVAYYTPQTVVGITNAVDIDCGRNMGCVIKDDGTLWCWGRNLLGGVGVGVTIGTEVPTAVNTGLSGVDSVDVTHLFACAKLSDGSARCWGQGASGRLGDLGTTDTNTPGVLNAAVIPSLTGVVDIAVSNQATCAVITDGTVRCWGGGGSLGNLGDGNGVDSNTGVVATGLSNVIKIEGTYSGFCALIQGGTVRCWGQNSNGIVGDGNSGVTALTPQSASGLTDVNDIFSGQGHMCATLTTGTMKCWGANGAFQVGDNTQVSKDVPTEVLGISCAVATDSPTNAPSTSPTQSPSTSPTQSPSTSPTQSPSISPTKAPSTSPTQSPSVSPTKAPSASPTPQPTDAPTVLSTPAPTSASQSLTIATIKFSSTNTTRKNEIIDDFIEQINVEFPPNANYNVSKVIKIANSGTLTLELIQAISNRTQLEDAFKDVHCGTLKDYCTVDIEFYSRRLLSARSLATSLPLEITFDIPEALLSQLDGIELDDGSFEQAIADALGIDLNSTDIIIDSSDSSITVDAIVSANPGDDPLDTTLIDASTELQNDMDTIIAALIAQAGGGSFVIETDIVLCPTDRTCNGRGTCDENTGVCDCVGDWWGIDCETPCECGTHGDCVNAYCVCEYPWYGLRCDDESACSDENCPV